MPGRIDEHGSVDAGDLPDDDVIETGRLDCERLALQSGCLFGGTCGDDEHRPVLGVRRCRGESPQGIVVALSEDAVGDVVESLTP